MNDTPSDALGEKPICSAGAQRMARCRRRRQKGLRCVTVELREREIDYLIRSEFLAAESRTDPAALRAALHRWLDRAFPG
jgi:hypothetical protein